MYQDIISYKLAEGITEETLLKEAKVILESWMKKQEGFLEWQINKNNDGHYTDIVKWSDKESAKKAETLMQKDLSQQKRYKIESLSI